MNTTQINTAAQASINAYLSKVAPALPSRNNLKRTIELPFSGSTLAWVLTGATLLGGACYLIDTFKTALGA